MCLILTISAITSTICFGVCGKKMEFRQRSFEISSFIFSGFSIGLLVFSMLSSNWVDGTFRYENSTQDEVLYTGLFKGTYYTYINESKIHDVYQTCIPDSKVCAFSCKTTENARLIEVNSYYNRNPIDLSCTSNVDPIEMTIPENVVWFKQGIYIATISFQSIAMFLSGVSILYMFYTIVIFPNEPKWGNIGPQVWNGCSAICSTAILIMWGVHYNSIMKENLSFILTMYGPHTELKSNLGFSYWILIGSAICNIMAQTILKFKTAPNMQEQSSRENRAI